MQASGGAVAIRLCGGDAACEYVGEPVLRLLGYGRPAFCAAVRDAFAFAADGDATALRGAILSAANTEAGGNGRFMGTFLLRRQDGAVLSCRIHGDVWQSDGAVTAELHLQSEADAAHADRLLPARPTDAISEGSEAGAERMLKALNERLSRDEALSVYDPVLLANVFEYLFEAADVDRAIDDILQLVGRRYRVSRAYIFEDSPDHATCTNTFEWCAPGVSPEKANLSELSYADTFGDNFADNFDGNGVFVCGSVDSLPADQGAFLAAQGICAMLQCAIFYDGVFSGFIGFDDCDTAREWTREQVGTLALLGRIIGMYLLKKREREAAALGGDFLNALDNNSLAIYLVDPATHALLFRNRAFLARFGDGADGRCYAVLCSGDAPCQDCPMRAVGKSGEHLPTEINRPDGSCFLAQASPIRWNKRDIYMVTLVDVSERRTAENALRMSAEEVAVVIRQSGKQVVRFDIATDTAENMLDTNDVLGLPWHTEHFEEAAASGVIAEESLAEHRAFFRAIRAGEKEGACNLLVRCAGDEMRWYHADFAMIYALDGRPSRALISFYDNTEQRKKEITYQQWLSRLDRILSENVPYLEVNLTKDRIERMENLLSARSDERRDTLTEHVRLSVLRAVLPEDAASYTEFFDRERLIGGFYAGAVQDGMDVRMRQSGQERWYRVNVEMARYPYSEEIRAFVTYTDIDEEKRGMLKLRESAAKDPLTRLWNRNAFSERVASALLTAQPLQQSALFMIDLDNFKRINDTFGHQQGDAVIVRAAVAIREVFRTSDLSARLGGDEFMVFMHGGASVETVRRKAAALLDALRFTASGVGVSASVGVSMVRGNSAGFDALYCDADRAMYEAKRDGKDRFVLSGGEGAAD